MSGDIPSFTQWITVGLAVPCRAPAIMPGLEVASHWLSSLRGKRLPSFRRAETRSESDRVPPRQKPRHGEPGVAPAANHRGRGESVVPPLRTGTLLRGYRTIPPDRSAGDAPGHLSPGRCFPE